MSINQVVIGVNGKQIVEQVNQGIDCIVITVGMVRSL